MNYYVQIGVGRWGFKAKRNKFLCRMVIHQAAATRCGIAETLGGNVFSPCESHLHGRILLLCGKTSFHFPVILGPCENQVFPC